MILTKSDYEKACWIREQFLIWISNGCKGQGPNGYELKQLFKRAFPGSPGAYTYVITDFGPLPKKEKVNIVDCFPSSLKELLQYQFALLDSIRDTFEWKYRQNYDVIYWLRLLVFLPSNTINYIGSHSTRLKNTFDVLWWIICFVSSILKII